MGSIIQKLADEIELHGSYQAYCDWRDKVGCEIPYFSDPEIISPETKIQECAINGCNHSA